MRRVVLTLAIAFVLLATAATPGLAQDDPGRTLGVDRFTFSYPASMGADAHITNYPGDPPDSREMFAPQPPYTEVLVYDAGADQGRPFPLQAPIAIHIYRIADAAGYEYVQQQMRDLQTLLAQRPDLSTYMQPEGVAQGPDLPFLPQVNAAQVIRAQAQYVDLPTISGISYITTFAQAVVPFTAQGFFYTFQGLTADGEHYIAAVIPVTNTLFPPDIPQDFDFDAFMAELDSYNAESLATLNNAAPGDFSPSLDTLDALFASFAFAPEA